MKLRILITLAFLLVGSACSSDDVVVGSTVEPGQTQPAPETVEFARVAVIGDSLPSAPADDGADPATGLVAPELQGIDFDGDSVTIGNDGRAKAVVFVAHWCPHCQAEVPVLADLVAEGAKPPELDLYVVSTAVYQDRENFPPSQWLKESGLEANLMVDSEDFDGLVSFGAGGFPFTVYLDTENRVLRRTQGTADSETIKALWLDTAGA